MLKTVPVPLKEGAGGRDRYLIEYVVPLAAPGMEAVSSTLSSIWNTLLCNTPPGYVSTGIVTVWLTYFKTAVPHLIWIVKP